MRIVNTRKKGFTLVELIVVVAILSIVAGAIYSIMQLSVVSFRTSNNRSEIQSVSRLALNDMKKHLGVAKYIHLFLEEPETIPESSGFIFFDQDTNSFVVRSLSGREMTYALANRSASSIQLYFTPVEPSQPSLVANTLRLEIIVDGYAITTEVYIQNLDENSGQIVSYFDTNDSPHPAQFVVFY